jgi:hypothetical protein
MMIENYKVITERQIHKIFYRSTYDLYYIIISIIINIIILRVVIIISG